MIRLVVHLDRRQVDHRLGVALRQHPAIVGVALWNAIALHRLLHTFGCPAAYCDQLGAAGYPVKFGQVVTLGDIAAAKQCQFDFRHGQPCLASLTFTPVIVTPSMK